MGRVATSFGLARSVAIYYGIPFRRRRLQRLYAQFVTPGSLCFDIGAHVGNRIRCWRALGARVVAVEPQSDAFRFLVRCYSRDADVSLVRCAVGRTSGMTTLRISELNPTVASVSADWINRVSTAPDFAGVTWNKTESVKQRTVDELITAYGRPDFLKIDVEGHEAEVLAGLSTAVAALSFEYIVATRDVAIACVDRLAELGDYRYNISHGESHRLALREWVDRTGIEKLIAGLPAQSGSGDIYAQLGGSFAGGSAKQ
jgi:FkbM family methyltransferase